MNPWARDVPDKRLKQLEEENTGLRELISQMKVELAVLKKGDAAHRSIEGRKTEQIPYKYTHPMPAVPRAYEDIMASLREMPLLKKPPRFVEALSETETLYKRQLMMLYMLATKGVNARVELDLVLGIEEGIGPRSATIRRVAEKTETGNLIHSMTRFIDKPLHTGLTLVWLTPTGKEFCREMGWEVQESEWERLIRLRGEGEGETNLAIIIFAMHARSAGIYRPGAPGGGRKGGGGCRGGQQGGEDDLYVYGIRGGGVDRKDVGFTPLTGKSVFLRHRSGGTGQDDSKMPGTRICARNFNRSENTDPGER